MNPVFAAVTLLSAAFYAYFVLSARSGLRRAAMVRPTAAVVPSISIVVALKNEAHNVSRLTAALLKQEYPRDRLQFVLVDDASSDDTPAKLQEFAQRDERVRVVFAPPILPNATSVTGGKARALAEGIRVATGEILLMTDADCEPPSSWVRTMGEMFEDPVAYVVGPVAERSPGIFGAVKALDYFGIVATSAGRIGMNKPVNSLGANAAFRRSAYEQAGGFSFERRLGDEEYLMHTIYANGLGRVVFCADPKAKVLTHAGSTFSEFWSQRMRWASMKDRYPRTDIVLELGLVYALFPLLALSGLLSIWIAAYLPLFAITLFVKVLVDATALISAGRILDERIPVGTFILSELLHIPYIIIVVIAGQFFAVRWKGRTVAA